MIKGGRRREKKGERDTGSKRSRKIFAEKENQNEGKKTVTEEMRIVGKLPAKKNPPGEKKKKLPRRRWSQRRRKPAKEGEGRREP